jgi:UDP-N-acetylmuramoyl-L-alanyl-D-glutamate--2,6-diaminopimelate ligase
MTSTLGALLDVVARRAPDVLVSVDANDGTLISSVTQDSREATHGSLFCAIRGVASDGHDFVADAVANGAAAVLVEQPTTTLVPEVVVPDSRRATGHLAAAFVGNPSDDVSLVGVTGTNGKTSIVSLIEHLVGFCGGKAASMGTLTGSLTTSPAPQFQAALREHADAGCNVVAAEISSHALDQDRVAGARVRVAVFSNLSQDHLDYHSDIESYFEAKARLFSKDLTDRAVIDVSDLWGRRLAAQTDIPVSEIDGSAIADAAVLTPTSSRFTWRDHQVALPLGGRFSVHNAVLAAEACVLLGFEVATLAEGLASVPQVPGRFESVDSGQPFSVVVDYSHTPASVDAAVASARDLTSERVLIVFGAAGDRDPGKRPLIGAAASHADVLYVTSDNPRTEDPDMIIDEVVAGLGDTAVHRIPDRRQAINAAISEARSGDVVLIAGKGHEDYQIIGTTSRAFDDRDEARAALAAIGWEVDA